MNKTQSTKDSIISRILAVPGAICSGLAYGLSGFLFTPKPRFVCFPVTFRCNSKCQMCNIWMDKREQHELDLATIQRVFSNRLFAKVERAVLHGGEPTLRKDIASIYEIMLSALRKLENITLSTNGLVPGIVEKRVGEILAIENPHRVQLTFTVSVDGLRASHDAIRGVPGAFDSALTTIRVLKQYQAKHRIEIDIITVIQPQNLDDLPKMMELADEYGVGLIFQPMMIDTFYGNSASNPRLRFSDAQIGIYRDFISRYLSRDKSPRSLFWRNYLEMLEGGMRRIPCAYDRYVLSLYPTGEVLACAKVDWKFGNVLHRPVDEIWFSENANRIRKRMRREVCAGCDFYCGAEYSLAKEFFTYGIDVLKRAWRREAVD